MIGDKQIKSALLSVYHKDGLDKIALRLNALGIKIYSTGGTRTFLENLGLEVVAVEDVTSYPSILGGRVKTLHPRIFGGILGRRDESSDLAQLEEFDIPELDLVIVDLYPFGETLKSGASDEEIIEKIDIGGVSLIRAAAKNFKDVLIISSRDEYPELADILDKQNGISGISQRKKFAGQAFRNTCNYDTAIANWHEHITAKPLRYGENPHQSAHFEGNLSEVFVQLHGKDLSYNNLLDIDAALNLIKDFPGSGCAVIKHNNACGAAVDSNQLLSWKKALSGDPLSAFGGIIVFNTSLENETAREIDDLFFEVILAPGYSPESLEILSKKKNRIILQTNQFEWPSQQKRSILNGLLCQSADFKTEKQTDFKIVTETDLPENLNPDLEFALILVKHTKSNAIVLVKDLQMISSGTGQTSRVDALKQAIEKAGRMGFETRGSVLASDAFFPFPDCVELSSKSGISAIIQPGGSMRDQESIDAANRLKIPMAFSGIRHFKH